MKTNRVIGLTLALCALLTATVLLMEGCAKAPPSLSPIGQSAWNRHELEKDLDILRDIAVDAEAQHVIATLSARAVVSYHQTAITVMHDAQAGWQKILSDGFDGLQRNLPPADYARIKAYVDLARATLKELTP